MADIRINALATTAASTASDDFVAVDGSANGTRKLNAYSPTFGGNLTVSGGTITGGSITTALAASGSAGHRVDVFAGAANQSSNVTFYNSGSAGAGNASYGRVGMLSNTNFRDFIIDTGANGTGVRGNIALNPGASGTVSTDGNLTVSGGTITGGTSGMSLAAGGTNQKITLTPSGNGFAEIVGGSLAVATFIKGGGFAQGVSLGTTGSVPFVQGYASNTFGSFANLTLQPSGSNVLIGTTTDGGQKLQVAGDAKFSGSANGFTVNSATGNAIAVFNSSAADAGVTNNAYITIQTAGVARWYLGQSISAADGNFQIYGAIFGAPILTLNKTTGATTLGGNLTVSGTQNVLGLPASASALSTNSTMTFELTSNTSLTIKVRGTDGTTRSVALTLA